MVQAMKIQDNYNDLLGGLIQPHNLVASTGCWELPDELQQKPSSTFTSVIR